MILWQVYRISCREMSHLKCQFILTFFITVFVVIKVLGDSHFFISFKGVLPFMIGSVRVLMSDDADNACVFIDRDGSNCSGAG